MPNASLLRALFAHRVGRSPLRDTANVWRQWAFVGVSLIHANKKAKLLPDVQQMLASFEVVPLHPRSPQYKSGPFNPSSPTHLINKTKNIGTHESTNRNNHSFNDLPKPFP